VVGDDGTGFVNGLQAATVEDSKGRAIPSPTPTYAPLNAADIDGLSITPDGTHGAIIDGGNSVFFFLSNLSTGSITILPPIVDVSAFGGDGDAIGSLPGGDEVVVSAGGTTNLALISGVLSGNPVIAESIPMGNSNVEHDGLVISSDGQVMLSRAGLGDSLDVYSVSSVPPHPGPMGGTVDFAFTLVKTLTVPTLCCDGREGMAISPADSSRGIVVGNDGSVTLYTGLPSAPVVKSSISLQTNTPVAVTITTDGKFAIVAVSGGLVVIGGVDTGTLAQVGSVYSPTFSTPAGNCTLNSPQTLAVTADGNFVVTIQNCGLTKSSVNIGSGVMLTIPVSSGVLGSPAGQLNYSVTPLDDQLLTH